MLLPLLVLLAYLPAWRAGFVWDDSVLLTGNPCIAGPLGFREIWTTRLADICPLTISAFWVEHRFWGFLPAPYHVVNILLHAGCAVLLWRVLKDLGVRRAWMGAALWALHPVEVDSVAWVTELKNTLSGAFFLSSLLFFLKWFRGNGAGRLAYVMSLFFAACAMASKSSTVVLPAVVVLCAWWMEGRVRWRHVVAVAPMLLMAAAAGVSTLWIQRASLVANAWALPGDAQWARPWAERAAGAGEAVWFYLGKLLWPHPLMAIYPRWRIDAGNWLAWLPLLGVAVALILLWGGRRSSWGRAGFFAFGYFLIALAPVLGLLDGTDFHFSLVFDHFQYLASMGPLALAGAAFARLPGRGALGAAALLALGMLSWQRSGVFKNEETFWSDAVAKNPDAWLGHGNLANALMLRGDVDDAMAHYRAALAINPRDTIAHNNLGAALLQRGRIAEAVEHETEAISINPSYAEAHSNLGNALSAEGQLDEAISHYNKALALNPTHVEARSNLGIALLAKGEVDAAIAQFEAALAVNPAHAASRSNLGNAYLAKRQPNEAILQYRKALAIDANYAEAHYNLGIALMRTARFAEAAVEFGEVQRLRPDYPNIDNDLAAALRLARP